MYLILVVIMKKKKKNLGARFTVPVLAAIPVSYHYRLTVQHARYGIAYSPY